MTFLVDANVLSEPTRPSPDTKVVDWLSANERTLVVDSIVLGELYFGVLSLPAGNRKTRLEHWFDSISKAIECLPWDASVSRQWAKMVVALKRKGTSVPLLDGMTRNVNDFKPTGVKVVNPFA
jgi:predicted nucleic acid-binding protein